MAWQVDAQTLSLLKAEFERRDTDRSGWPSRAEATGLQPEKRQRRRWLRLGGEP